MVMADPPASSLWSASSPAAQPAAEDATEAVPADRSQQRREESAYVDRARAGDAQAFEWLMLSCQERLYGFIQRTCGNTDDAQDLFQDTVLRAFRHIGEFQGKSSFSTWLHTIAYHLWCSRVRREAGRSRPEEGGKLRPKVQATGEILETQAVDLVEPDAALQTGEIRARVRAAVNQLEEPDHTIIVMREFGGRSYEDIAEITGMRLGAIKSRLHRARRKLAELLKGLLEPDT
ncbi:MAG: RNA polymerase sigma factor [Planctomycetota bacterium]